MSADRPDRPAPGPTTRASGREPRSERRFGRAVARARAVAGTLAAAVAGTVAVVGLVGCGADTAEPVTLSADGVRGRDVAVAEGCANCHSVTGGTQLGPTWKGVWATTVELADGTTITYDDTYVETSVRDPSAQRRPGDWPQMPAYPAEALSDAELALVVTYIREVGSAAPAGTAAP